MFTSPDVLAYFLALQVCHVVAIGYLDATPQHTPFSPTPIETVARVTSFVTRVIPTPNAALRARNPSPQAQWHQPPPIGQSGGNKAPISWAWGNGPPPAIAVFGGAKKEVGDACRSITRAVLSGFSSISSRSKASFRVESATISVHLDSDDTGGHSVFTKCVRPLWELTAEAVGPARTTFPTNPWDTRPVSTVTVIVPRVSSLAAPSRTSVQLGRPTPLPPAAPKSVASGTPIVLNGLGAPSGDLRVTTTADVVACRQYPDTVITDWNKVVNVTGHTNLNVQCWTLSSLEGPLGIKDASNVWLRDAKHGCWINEKAVVSKNDLRRQLQYCPSPPHWIAGLQSQYSRQDCYEGPTLDAPSKNLGAGHQVDLTCQMYGEGVRGNHTWVKHASANCYFPGAIFDDTKWLGGPLQTCH